MWHPTQTTAGVHKLTPQTISKLKPSSIKEPTGPSKGVSFFRAYRDCLCQPLRRNSMAEVDLLLANKLIISNPILLFPGLDNPDCLAKCETLSGGACPSSPGHWHHWHHWHLHQPPPSFLHSQLQQDPHHLLLVCLTLSLLSKSSCIHS